MYVLTVIDAATVDHDAGDRAAFTITGVFPTLSAIKRAILIRSGIDIRQQLLLHVDRLMFGERDYFVRFDLEATPTITLHRRQPDDQLLIINVRHKRRGRLSCSFQADLPVTELMNHLARKYCMAPWKQVLMTLKAPMLSSGTLGDYATGTRMEVSLSEYFDGRLPSPLRVKVVVDEETGKEQTFLVEKRDTLDVLVGHLERAGAVGRDETPSFLLGSVLLNNWTSFEECEITEKDILFLSTRNE